MMMMRPAPTVHSAPPCACVMLLPKSPTPVQRCRWRPHWLSPTMTTWSRRCLVPFRPRVCATRLRRVPSHHWWWTTWCWCWCWCPCWRWWQLQLRRRRRSRLGAMISWAHHFCRSNHSCPFQYPCPLRSLAASSHVCCGSVCHKARPNQRQRPCPRRHQTSWSWLPRRVWNLVLRSANPVQGDKFSSQQQNGERLEGADAPPRGIGEACVCAWLCSESSL